MTETERETLERDVIFQAEQTKRDYEAHRIKAAQIGEKLEALGQALQNHPELVNPLPEIDAPDYREGLNLLNSRQEVITLCHQVRTLREKAKNAAQRKAALGY